MVEIIGRNGHRNPTQKGSDLVTRAEAEAIAETTAVKVTEYYVGQVPGIVVEVLLKLGLIEPRTEPLTDPASEPTVQ